MNHIITSAISLSLVLLTAQTVNAQEKVVENRTAEDAVVAISATTKIPSLKISGYIEAYYAFDFSNPDNHQRPGFLYSFNRHNEFNLNFGFIQAEYANDRVRGKLALMAGTYSNTNLSAEPGVLKNIYEANVGVKISKTKNVWIDAGIFSAHIGFESAKGADCWTLTRSILAENSPYFLTGAKISYLSKSEKWFLSGLIFNGWQHIQRPDGHQMPAFGHQLTWTPNAKVTLNSSSFIGSETPDSVLKMRYFHNLYGKFQLNEKFGLLAGFDIGIQQKSVGSESYDLWYAPILIFRYAATDRLAFGLRAELYSDERQVIIPTGTPNGFQTTGYSINMDLAIWDNVLWRVEARVLNSLQDRIFVDINNTPDRNNYTIGTSLSIAF